MTFEISREFMIKTLAKELNESDDYVIVRMRKKNFGLTNAEAVLAAKVKVKNEFI